MDSRRAPPSIATRGARASGAARIRSATQSSTTPTASSALRDGGAASAAPAHVSRPASSTDGHAAAAYSASRPAREPPRVSAAHGASRRIGRIVSRMPYLLEANGS
jgi:hypothetical protein